MIITGLIMGFAGSLHCVGMCSPLAMAVSNLNPAATLNRLIYNLGRILTYGILGVVLGSAGWLLPFSRFQSLLSIILGASILIIAVLGINSVHLPVFTKVSLVVTHHLKSVFASFIKRKNYFSIFFLGVLNGLLPCGLTLLAFIYCITLGNPLASFYYMLSFGIGTLPVMLGLTILFQYGAKRFNINFKKLTTIVFLISGCALIVRVFFFHGENMSTEEQQVVDIILCR